MPNSVNVLLVERDFNVRQALGEALESESYTVTLAASGCDAVQHLQHSRETHAAVVDLPLDVSYGWHLLDQLRRVKPGLPIIVLTTARGQAQPCAGRPVALLEKPLDLPLLIETLRLATTGSRRLECTLSNPAQC